MLGSLLPPLNMQSLSLLAVVAGLVVISLAMWYLWTMQQQMQTDMQYLQLQHSQLASSTQPRKLPGDGTPEQASVRATVADSYDDVCQEPSKEAVDREAHAAERSGSARASSSAAPDALPTPEISSAVYHRSMGVAQPAHDDISSSSDYDDDDDDDDDAKEMVKANDALAVNDICPTTLVDVGGETAPSLVESLLSNIVTESINQQMPASSAMLGGGVEMDLGAKVGIEMSAVGGMATTVVMLGASEALARDNAVSVVNGADAESLEVVDLDGDALSPTTIDLSSAASTDSTASLPEDFLGCQGDPSLLAETLRQKTVAELKKLCGDCEVGVKKGKGFKRKDELIEALVHRVCTSAEVPVGS